MSAQSNIEPIRHPMGAVSEVTREAARKAAWKATKGTRQGEEAKKAYQKVYQKAYRARQKAWKAQQAARIKALREAREKATREKEGRKKPITIRGVPTTLTDSIEHALELRRSQREETLAVRSQLITYEKTLQSNYIARAHFFFNQVLEELYPIDEFSDMEQIPCGPKDYGYRIEREEFE